MVADLQGSIVVCVAAFVAIPFVLDALGFPPTTVIIRYVRKIIRSLPFRVCLMLCLIYKATYQILYSNGDGFAESNHTVLKYIVTALKNSIALKHLKDFYLFYINESKIFRWAAILMEDCIGILLIMNVTIRISELKGFSLTELKGEAVDYFVDFLKDIPSIRKEMEMEEEKLRVDLEKDLKDSNRKSNVSLPEVGLSHETLLSEINAKSEEEDKKWMKGQVSGTVYSGEKDHSDLLNKTYAAYSLSNPLHTDIWPSVNQFEAEIVSMTSSLVNGGSKSIVGCTSSGGTESIILAAKAHKTYFRNKYGISNPEIIACYTAHAGIEKACDMLNIRLVRVGFDSNFKIDPKRVKKLITSNTIMIFSSAPNFPQGVIDPIEELSELAVEYGVGLHVDCCLGGFVLPFAKRLGYDIPSFDFTLSGVTSMSLDTHKYGYASKGTSVVLYRNKELRRSQYFTYSKWMGGLYATPTIAGSRPGALLACAWVSLMSMGEDGYNKRVKAIIETSLSLASKISEIDGLKLLGETTTMIVCFSSDNFNIYEVGDSMTRRGWSLNSLQNPPCIHLCVTIPIVEHANHFIRDLSAVVNEVRRHPKKHDGHTAAMYGKAGSLPKGPIDELLKAYIDVTLTP